MISSKVLLNKAIFIFLASVLVAGELRQQKFAARSTV